MCRFVCRDRAASIHVEIPPMLEAKKGSALGKNEGPYPDRA